MVQLLEFPSFKDQRGTLTVIEKALPFAIQRVYYIYGTNELDRGGHRHLVGRQALICLHKKCIVQVKTESFVQEFILSKPHQCLLLEAEEWHKLNFEPDSILLVLASHHYDPKNYVADGLDRSQIGSQG